MLARLAGELEDWGERLGHPAVDTLYLGGGTPSLLTVGELTALTEAVHRAFDAAGLLEATLEANPGTIAPGWLSAARRMGWDRISLGVQTLDDGLLRRLGRVHDAREGLAALRQAREAGFERASADLLLGIPGQDLSRVPDDAAALVAAGANHLSIYLLDLDKPCFLKAQVDRGGAGPAPGRRSGGRLRSPPGGPPRARALPLRNQQLRRARRGLAAQHPLLGASSLPGPGTQRGEPPGPLALDRVREHPGMAGGGGSGRAAGAGSGGRTGRDPPARAEDAAGRGLAGPPRSRAEAEGLLGLVDQWEVGMAPFFRHGLLDREGPMLRFTRKGLLLSNAVLELFV